MREMRIPRVAMVFAGCFLGAGYVSGQELWQFFGSFGPAGLAGLAIAMGILALFGILTFRTAQITGRTLFDEVVIGWDAPVLKTLMSVLENLLMFGVVAVMAAGVGALFQQMLNLPGWLGCLVFSAVVLAFALFGLQAVASAFSVTVPLLVAATVLVCIVSIRENGLCLPPPSVQSHALLGNFAVGAVNFACYNMFLSIAILAPFVAFIPRRSTVYCGVGLGTVLLAVLAMGVLVTLSGLPEAVEAELPMLFAAARLTSFGGWLYAGMLALAMFGTALSSFVGISHYFTERWTLWKHHPKPCAALLCLLAFGASLFGFGDLISVLYPLYGYGSIVFLLIFLIRFIKLKTDSKKSA